MTDEALTGIEPDADELDIVDGEPETAGTETEDDITDASDIDFRDVVLAPSDWTVETILSQLTNNSFELDPDFQRRNAWTEPRKSKFIESLMVGLPIPQLVFAEHEDEYGEPRYVVIDGKQRLLALEAFYSAAKPLRLSGLTVLPQLNGKTREELLSEPSFGRFVRRLSNRTIRTVVIRRWPHESFLHLVFHRINHQTLSLSAQELRQALHPGAFTKFADQFAGHSEALHRILGAAQRPDFRMRDVELLVRHIGYRHRITEYKGNLKKFLDDTCSKFNEEWPTVEEELKNAAASCEASIEVTERIFGDHAFRRRTARSWETRFNRAVFDIMSYYFSEPEIAEEAEAEAEAVREAFVALSESDSRFGYALAATTKTLPATAYRLSAWGRTLSEVLDRPIVGPISHNGKEIVVEELQ